MDYGVGTGDYTLEAWQNYLAENLDKNTIQLSDIAGGAKYSSNASKSLFLGGTYNWYGTAWQYIPNPSGWHHRALVRHNGTVTLYTDGKVTAVLATNDTHDFSGMRYAIIGNGYNLDRALYGYVESIRFANHAIYTSEFIPERFNKDKYLYITENKGVYSEI